MPLTGVRPTRILHALKVTPGLVCLLCSSPMPGVCADPEDNGAGRPETTGWGGTRWGMTTSETKKALNGRAREVQDASTTLGLIRRLRIDGQVEGSNGVAWLEFSNESDKLMAVTVELARETPARPTYEWLGWALAKKYGAATQEEAQPGGAASDLNVSIERVELWRLKSSEIRLVWCDCREKSYLFIRYSAPVELLNLLAVP